MYSDARADARGRTDAGRCCDGPSRRCRKTSIAAREQAPRTAPVRRRRTTCRHRQRGREGRRLTRSATGCSSSAAASVFEPAKVPGSVAWRIRGMLAVRDAVRVVFRTQLDDAPEERIVEARQLSERHLRFLRPPATGRCRRARTSRPSPAIPTSRCFSPSKLTTPRPSAPPRRPSSSGGRWSATSPVEHVETAAEALAVSLNETGEIDWPRMEQVTGRTARAVAARAGQPRLSQSGGRPVGNRRPVSERRRAPQAGDGPRRRRRSIRPIERNIEALKAVQPADLEPGDIEARLGSSWIPATDIRDFVAAAARHCARATCASATPRRSRPGPSRSMPASKYSVGNTTTHGTARFRASDLIEQALNGRTPTAYDEHEDGSRVINQQETIAAREKQQQLKDRFREWIWEDSARAARLAREYNDRFNNLRLRSFDGSHLTLPGMVREHLRDGDLSRHQKDAVWRDPAKRQHAAGACRRRGQDLDDGGRRDGNAPPGACEKADVRRAQSSGRAMGRGVPEALSAGAACSSPGREHFATGNRQRAMARIASGNYDAVIVSHRSFEFLPVSDKLFNRFVEEQVEELEAAILEAKAGKGDNRRIVKELEKAKKRFVAKLKKRADRERKDNTLTFEELGVDQIFVDEADLYKNLFYTTKMNRIAGLPNSDSNRAFDMYMKTRYVREINGGRGVVFATGTPISNTMAEMYTMLRYLGAGSAEGARRRAFRRLGGEFRGSGDGARTGAGRLGLPDAHALCEIHQPARAAVDVPHLRRRADRRHAEPAAPGRRERQAADRGGARQSEPLKAFIKTLTERAEQLRTPRVDPSVDNMLKITGDGRKAALDMRLVDPFARAARRYEAERARCERIRTVWERHAATPAQRSSCSAISRRRTRRASMSTTKCAIEADRRAAFRRREIAFIHDADSDAAKKTAVRCRERRAACAS